MLTDFLQSCHLRENSPLICAVFGSQILADQRRSAVSFRQQAKIHSPKTTQVPELASMTLRDVPDRF
jgi:hypothetical protein